MNSIAEDIPAVADPIARRLVDDADLAMMRAENPVAKLQAIGDCVAKLDPMGDHDAVDYLSEIARERYGLDDNSITAAIAHGCRIRDGAVQLRSTRSPDLTALGTPTAKSSESDADSAAAKRLAATAYVFRDPASIPRRQFLYGRHYIRRYVSGTVGQGGSGKTSLGTVETLSMVSARALLGGPEIIEPLRVWYLNLEDPKEEIERRIQAACLHFGLTAEDLADRLFADSGRDTPCIMATTAPSGVKIVKPVVEKLIAEIKAKRIDVVIVDPFVSSHAVSENDNMAIDSVIKQGWGAVAEQGNCAVELSHHLRKLGDGDVAVEDARGAVAFIAGCRSVRVLCGMSTQQAERAQVENRLRYFRVFNGKANLAPRDQQSEWFYLESVDLGNGPHGDGDRVQVATHWQYPSALSEVSAADLLAVQKLIAGDEWALNQRAEKWAGKAVAQVLEWDLNSAPVKNDVRGLLEKWISTGALKAVWHANKQRKNRQFVEVGQWAT